MKLVQKIGGAKGQHLPGQYMARFGGCILASGRCKSADGRMARCEEIYEDLLGLPLGVPKWVRWRGTVHTCAWCGVHLLFGEMVAKITQYVTTAVWGLSIFYGIFGRFVFSAGSTKNALLSFLKEIRTPSVPQQRQCYMKDQMLLQYARL